MKIKFNPFSIIIAPSASSPFSEILNRGLLGKFRDAFEIFRGGPADSGTWHLGIVDYLSCGFLVLLELPGGIIMDSNDHEPRGYKILYEVPALFLFLISLFIRTLLAAIMTLLFSPVIVFVHIIASVAAKKDFETVSTLEVRTESVVHDDITRMPKFSYTHSLARELNDGEILDGSQTDRYRNSVHYDPETTEFKFYTKTNKHDSTCYFARKNGPLKDNADQKNAYAALMRLNLFGVAQYVDVESDQCIVATPQT